MKTIGVAAIIWVMGLTVAALGLDTPAIPNSEIQKRRVPMTALTGDPLVAPVRTPDFVLSMREDGSPVVKGLDDAGRPWRMVLPPAIRGSWVTTQNRRRTYFFAGYTGGAGMAPDTWILVMAFDPKGRPIPFFLRTYAGYDAKGIRDLLEFDASGQVLLQQTWLETHWMPHERSGYFVTNAYCRQGHYWYRADGNHGQISFPLFEKWAGLPNTRPEIVGSPNLPKERNPDYGNDPRFGTRATILGVDQHRIHTGPELGCDLEFVDVVVADSPRGREMEVIDPTIPDTLLPTLARRRKLTTFTGLYRWPNSKTCTAAIAWSL